MMNACQWVLEGGRGGVYAVARSFGRLNFVPVETLRRFDPELGTFKGVNMAEGLIERLRAYL